LRLDEGVALDDVEPLDEPQLRSLRSMGLVATADRMLRLTPKGRPLAGAVTLRLLPYHRERGR
jgi:coproporphyrinogen III oxidase-like Fe-S oxidoreductase